MSKCPDRMIRKCVAAGLAGLALGAPAAADPLGLGREATPEEIAAWDIDVRPDGQGLPAGEGDVMTGEMVYTERCASCHGVFGEGAGRWPVLMGGFNTLESDRPVKTIGSYWPYASTIWDYVHRAMPFGDAQSLSDDEVYAVVAYLLYLNDLVSDDFVADAGSFAAVELPNEDGFIPDDRPETELNRFSGEVCMSACKEDVGITMRAAVLDVTPGGGGGADLEDGGVPVEAGDSGVADTAEAVPAEAKVEEGTATEFAAADPALVEQGESLFRQCRACHEVGQGAENRVGPHLNGVLGRTAGGLDGFRYSPAMAEAGEEGLVWDAAALAEFLSDPRGTVPGTKMAFRGLESEDAKAMAAYLGSLDGEG